MQKIINGKLYDTETATKISVRDIHDTYESFHIFEHLLKKITGEYFIFRTMYGDGDAVYEYEYTLSHMFEPLTRDEAMKWMEKYSSVEEYAIEFGLPEE